MKMDDSIFAVKLCEMEEQYGKLQCRIRVCEQGGREKIHAALLKAEDEYKENELLLEERARACRSKAVARLSEAQLEYSRRTKELMKRQIPEDVHSEESTAEEDEKEAGMLYAEFAMDFATLAVQQAMISALSALDKEGTAEATAEKTREEVGCRK